MALTIRRMLESDLPTAVLLEQKCFSHPWSEQSLRAELTHPRGMFFIAERDGMPVGYAGMQFIADEGYVANIAVDPAARRQGIGGALIDALCAFCGEQRLAFLTLEVRESNTPAIRLYAGRGFEPVGTRRGFYTDPAEDAVLMTRFFS